MEKTVMHRFFRLGLAVVTVMALLHTGAARAEQAVATPQVAASQRDIAKAEARFERGIAAYGSGDYDLALVEFRSAYQAAPTFQLLYNIALAQVGVGDKSGAIASFEQFLSEGGDAIDDARKNLILEEVRRLVGETSTILLESDVSQATYAIDGREVEGSAAHAPIRLNPGRYHLTVRAADGRVLEREIEVVGGRDKLVVMTFGASDASVDTLPPPTSRKVSEAPLGEAPLGDSAGKPAESTPFYSDPAVVIPLGLTAALATATGVSFAVTADANTRLDTSLSEIPLDRAKVDQNRDALRGAALATDVLGLATAAAAATTIVVLVLRGDSDTADVGTSTAPKIALGIGSASLSGRF